jgi:hypothetical protein
MAIFVSSQSSFEQFEQNYCQWGSESVKLGQVLYLIDWLYLSGYLKQIILPEKPPGTH